MFRAPRRAGSSLIALSGMAGLAGCALYEPLPLDADPHLAGSVRELRLDPPPGWGDARPIDPDQPLDIAAITLLAVENNPDLVTARNDRGVAQAEVLQAGILPNPQFSGSYAGLNAGPGVAAAWTAALSQDIKALVTFSSGLETAELSARQVDADILWREWQTISKAQLFYVDTIEQGRMIAGLRRTRAVLKNRTALDQTAVDSGNLTLPAISPDLAALADLDKTLADLERQAETKRRDLDEFLGLEPSVRLNLSDRLEPPRVDTAAIERTLGETLDHRPDLVALQLGYQSQDEKLFGAILAQFPTFVLGGAAQRDTSLVYSGGPTLTIDLPIFNRNQGAIALETATRQKLHDEYRNRRITAEGEIHALLADIALLQDQLAQARPAAEEATRTAAAAEAATAQSLLDIRSSVDLEVAATTRQQEVISIEQSLLEQQVALVALTGLGMPSVSVVAEKSGENQL